jgi:hypothetical protein
MMIDTITTSRHAGEEIHWISADLAYLERITLGAAAPALPAILLQA